jgi:hypothetical protein
MTAQAHTERFDAGVAAAKAALEASDGPILLMDEVGPGPNADAYAMGWNSVWASAENGQRWARVRVNPLEHHNTEEIAERIEAMFGHGAGGMSEAIQEGLEAFRTSSKAHGSFTRLTATSPFDMLKHVGNLDADSTD